MKKILVLLCLVIGMGVSQAQGFKAGFGVGYVSEIDYVAGSIDLIYDINDKFGISNTTMYTVNELENDNRVKWFGVDLNVRYTFYDEFYALVGGQYLGVTVLQRNTLGGFVSEGETIRSSEIGGNFGVGYIYNIIDNVNIFAEAKYTLLDTGVFEGSGYFHARLGMVFDF